MKYQLFFTAKAKKDLSKLDAYTQKKIQAYLNNNVSGSENPKAHGKALSENLSGYWRYRIGDYRVICKIHDDVCKVFAVNIGHRSKIYSKT
ncbi:MAG: type II toxin-antitoxin system RelE/ParE family toxin [Clostridiales Family XIII bacterium]|jgi:mRNA interferase RelE/StbE|nr:type II toxin-antitoxin system RelE/ParE family toxin [Clostridiales Family XIII bacterium]